MIIFANEEVLNDLFDCMMAISMLGEDPVFNTLKSNVLELDRVIEQRDLIPLRTAIDNKKAANYRKYE